jgi:hypothetical protein
LCPVRDKICRTEPNTTGAGAKQHSLGAAQPTCSCLVAVGASEEGDDSSWEVCTSQVRYCIKPLHMHGSVGTGPHDEVKLSCRGAPLCSESRGALDFHSAATAGMHKTCSFSTNNSAHVARLFSGAETNANMSTWRGTCQGDPKKRESSPLTGGHKCGKPWRCLGWGVRTC